MTGNELFLRFLVTMPLLLFSLMLHELAHGWVADKLGDPTPRQHGRLTLNPVSHLDLWGTVILVLSFVGSGGQFFFGWAKPVPISPWRFKDPQRGMMLVGAAGPAANYSLALISLGAIWLMYTWSLFLAQALLLSFMLNIVLGTLNLVPIPPLDGSRVLGGFLPRKVYPRWLALDRYGNWVFLGIVAIMVAFPAVFDATIGAVLRWSYNFLPGG